MSDPFIRTEFKLTAIFTRKGNEIFRFRDIVGMSATFALNSIPTCTLDVATGIEVRDEKPATIHDVVDRLEPRDRCVVELEIKSTDGRMEAPITNGMKDGKYIVFDGYYAGIGYQRSHNNCTYTIHLIHWLDDLNCSSMLNGDWSQGTQQDVAQVASSIVLSDLLGGGGTNLDPGQMPPGGFGARIGPMIDSKYPTDDAGGGIIVTPKNMSEDLWEKVIKRIFEAITLLKHPRLQCQDPEKSSPEKPPDSDAKNKPEHGREPGSNNEAAWNALRRMPGNVPAKYKATLPLNLTGLDSGEPHIYMGISAHDGLSRMILDGMGYNTIWSKLVGDIAPSFLFAISPCVDFAQAIPFFPGLSKKGKTPYVTITGEEYNYANFNANCAHMLSGIIIHWAPQGDGAQAVIGGRVPSEHGYCLPAGMYPIDDADYKHHWGNILVRDPPAWLANPVYTIGYTRDNELDTRHGSTAWPQEGNEENPEAKHKHRKVEKQYLEESKDKVDEKNLNVYDRFACHWYKSGILGQRYGELSGKLRFDIAPGSIVKINPPMTAIGKENTAMYGAVVQVSFAINAEQHTAGTSFSLSHLRTEKENDVNEYNSKVHYVSERAPVYLDNKPGCPWPGGPLIVGQEPIREGDIPVSESV
jgi:hypothetical protein